MHLAIRVKSLRRNLIIAMVIAGLTAGVAFAILQSQAKLTGNTISTASADLLISTDGIHYGQTVPGFNFGNIIPGGYPAPADGYSIYLKNTGSTVLSLKLLLDHAPTNLGFDDLNKINIGLTDVSAGTAPRGFILESLVNGGQPIEGDLVPGAARQYKLQALAADDATPGASVGDIDLAFVGTAHDPNDPN